MRIEPARRPLRGISLTPLVDVVFLLLVFFMLASTFLEYSGLDLADAKAGTATPDPAGIVVVRLLGKGRAEVAGTETSIAGLGPALADVDRPVAPTVAIVPGAGATVQDVASALEAVRRAPVAAVYVAR